MKLLPEHLCHPSSCVSYDVVGRSRVVCFCLLSRHSSSLSSSSLKKSERKKRDGERRRMESTEQQQQMEVEVRMKVYWKHQHCQRAKFLYVFSFSQFFFTFPLFCWVFNFPFFFSKKFSCDYCRCRFSIQMQKKTLEFSVEMSTAYVHTGFSFFNILRQEIFDMRKLFVSMPVKLRRFNQILRTVKLSIFTTFHLITTHWTSRRLTFEWFLMFQRSHRKAPS